MECYTYKVERQAAPINVRTALSIVWLRILMKATKAISIIF